MSTVLTEKGNTPTTGQHKVSSLPTWYDYAKWDSLFMENAMARRKANSRVGPVNSGRGRAGAAWDSVFLGSSSYGTVDPTPVQPAVGNENVQEVRRRTNVNARFHVAQDIIDAVNGDDKPLLPYQPTPTINPGRPRTLAAGYDENAMTLRVKFRDGDVYGYYNVPPSVWARFQRASSPGRFINSTLNRYPYTMEIDRPYQEDRPTRQGT